MFYLVIGISKGDNLFLQGRDIVDKIAILLLFFWIITGFIWQGLVIAYSREKQVNYALLVVSSVVFCVIWLIFLLPFSVVREFVFLNTQICLFWAGTLSTYLYMIVVFSLLEYYNMEQ